MKPKIAIYQILVRLFGNKKTDGVYSGTIEQNGVGKMNDITEKALSGIYQMGFTHIWLTGILEHATTTSYPDKEADPQEIVKGRAGSPYAVRDYYDINPDLAISVMNRMAEFEALVGRIHTAGMQVLIDFIPNHVARNYKSDYSLQHIDNLGINDDTDKAFLPSNNFYYIPQKAFEIPENIYPFGADILFDRDNISYHEFPAKATGNDCFTNKPNMSDWYETVKLNYGVDYFNGKKEYFYPVPDTWYKMTDILLFWCGKGVDGFRCDMAEMVPVAFWKFAIKKVKEQFPDILFVAEIYDENKYREYLFEGNFDYLYDKAGFYDTVRAVIENHVPVKNITTCWQRLQGIDGYMLRFLENHDEQRIASDFFAKDPRKALPGMVLAATMNKSPVMVYFGQEVGEPAQGTSGFSDDDGRTSIFDYTNVPEHQKWMNNGRFDGGMLSEEQRKLRKAYVDILHLCKHEAVISGSFYDLMWANNHQESLYCYLRYTEAERLLFILNFSGQDISTRIIIPQHAWECMKINRQETCSFISVFGLLENIHISKDKIMQEGLPIDIRKLQSVCFKIS